MAPSSAPREKPSRGDFVEAGTPGLVSPKAIYKPAPMYPARAKKFSRARTVVVSVLVDENGKVTEARVLPSRNADPEFDAECLRTARLYSFEPATLEGVAVKTRLTVPIVFRLEGE